MSNLTTMEDWIANGTTFNGTVSDSAGFSGMAGTPVIMGILAVSVVFLIIWKEKPTFDVSILAIITMLEIVTGVFLPEYLYWIFILIGGGFLGMGLIKMKKGG